MVTGNNTEIQTRCEYIDDALEQLTAQEGQLSIFLMGDGLSFSLAHRKSGKIVLLASYQLPNTPSAALDLLNQFNASFESYVIGWFAEKHTWIPKAMFDENEVSFLAKELLDLDHFQWTEVPELEAMVVHSELPANLERVVESMPHARVLPHAAIHALAITKHWKTLPGEHLYCHVEDGFLSVTAVDNGKLILQNTYSTKTDEDRLYFVLFAYEQLKFHPDQVVMKLSGTVTENDGFWNLLSKYIRRIELLENLDNLHPSAAVPQSEMRKFSPLIQLHTCG